MTSSNGNAYHHADQVATGQFAFSAVEAGDYMACFSAVDHKPEVTLSIDFEWRTGVQSKSWATVAKKSQVEVSSQFFFQIKSFESCNNCFELERLCGCDCVYRHVLMFLHICVVADHGV